MALCVGLSTFADLLVGKTVVLYSDNKGAEVGVCALSECGALRAFCTLLSGGNRDRQG